MKTDFTVEYGNKVIGDYMGKIYEDPLNFDYDTNWNSLMVVVERIYVSSNVADFSIKPGRTRIWIKGNGFIESPRNPLNNSIIECWIACILYIDMFHKK
jgi:hypothetical protein